MKAKITLLLVLVLFISSCGFIPINRGDVAVFDVVGFIDPEMTRDKIWGLKKLEEDNSIKAVVIRVDSPGGAVAASQEIYSAVKDLDAKKPVVISMGTVAASGGYYIACAGRRVFANEGTITGSIGVRIDHLWAGDLMKMIGIGHETLKTGKYKNLSPINRPYDETEKKFLQEIIDELREQFIGVVALNRKLPKEEIEMIASAKVFTGKKALELGLVDEIGGLYKAIESAGKLAGIKGKPKPFRIKKKKSFIASLFEEAKMSMASHFQKVPSYIWR